MNDVNRKEIHMKLTREEMETHIYFNEETDSIATIVTFNNKLKNKIIKAVNQNPNDFKIISEDQYGELVAECPRKFLSINLRASGKTRTRKMTEEQKQAFVERVHGKKS